MKYFVYGENCKQNFNTDKVVDIREKNEEKTEDPG